MKRFITISIICSGIMWIAKGQPAEKPYQLASSLAQEAIRKMNLLVSQLDRGSHSAAPQVLSTHDLLGTTYPLGNGGFEEGCGTSCDSKGSGSSNGWLWTQSWLPGATEWYPYNPINQWQDTTTHESFAHSGSWCAYFSPYENATTTLSTSFTIPANATSANLTAWLWILTEDSSSKTYDTLVFKLYDFSSGGAVLFYGGQVSNINADSDTNYHRWRIGDDSGNGSLMAHAGHPVKLEIISEQDFALSTYFLLDDVSLEVVTPGLATPTPTPTSTPQSTATQTPTPTPSAPATSGSKVVYSSGAAHAAGSNGAFWMTDMTFANGTMSDLTVKLFLNNATSGERFSFLLPMGQSNTIADIIRFMGLPDGSYVLRTEASCPVYAPGCSTELFSVTARTYSQGYGGWFGTALPSIPAYVGSKTIAFQEMSNSRKALYVFDRPTSVTTFDKTGVPIAYVDLGLFSAGQLTRLPLPESVSYVKVGVTANSFCYGTQVDNATQSQVIIY